MKKSTNPIIPDLGTFSYPLEVGNGWEYDRQVSTFNYRSMDSLSYPRYDDSVNCFSKITVEVVREETILDSIETSPSTRGFWSEKYYRNETDGLYLYATNKYGSGGNGLPKQNNSEKIVFKGIEFNSIAEITQSIELELPKTYKIFFDSIRYENPPINILKQPLEFAGEWVYGLRNQPFSINKRLLEKVVIEANTQKKFLCYKIEQLYDIDNNNIWDEDISVIEFIADEGIIKRAIFLKDLEITTAESPDGNGYFDWSEENI